MSSLCVHDENGWLEKREIPRDSENEQWAQNQVVLKHYPYARNPNDRNTFYGK